jgi:hypothetical protein
MSLDRRDFLRAATVVAGGALSPGCTSALLSWDDDAPRAASAPLFDPVERMRLAKAVDLILPATDTPGALEAGVPDFVEMMLVDYYYEPERKIVLDGLAELDLRSRARAGVAFVDTSSEVQTEILAELEQEGIASLPGGTAGLFNTVVPPPAFFQALRELVVVGFCTSEIASQHEFLFAPVHGDFEGCVPFDAVGRPYVG